MTKKIIIILSILCMALSITGCAGKITEVHESGESPQAQKNGYSVDFLKPTGEIAEPRISFTSIFGGSNAEAILNNWYQTFPDGSIELSTNSESMHENETDSMNEAEEITEAESITEENENNAITYEWIKDKNIPFNELHKTYEMEITLKTGKESLSNLEMNVYSEKEGETVGEAINKGSWKLNFKGLDFHEAAGILDNGEKILTYGNFYNKIVNVLGQPSHLYFSFYTSSEDSYDIWTENITNEEEYETIKEDKDKEILFGYSDSFWVYEDCILNLHEAQSSDVVKAQEITATIYGINASSPNAMETLEMARGAKEFSAE